MLSAADADVVTAADDDAAVSAAASLPSPMTALVSYADCRAVCPPLPSLDKSHCERTNEQQPTVTTCGHASNCERNDANKRLYGFRFWSVSVKVEERKEMNVGGNGKKTWTVAVVRWG